MRRTDAADRGIRGLRDLEGRRIAVLGAGREGLAAARLLLERLGHTRLTLLSETEPTPPRLRAFEALPGLELRVEPGVFGSLEGFDVLLRSPGINAYRAELAKARASGVIVTSLTDLFLAEHRRDTVIAVTGTKGKSTTASLLALALRAAGRPCVLAGNIGTPVFDAEDPREVNTFVLEVSSYQACDLRHGPRLAVLTELYPEHLDWHGGVETYYRDKLRLLERTKPGPVLVHAGNPEAVRRTAGLPHRLLYAHPSGMHLRGDSLWLRDTPVGELGPLSLRGAHQRADLCGALAALEALGLDPRAGLAGIAAFPGLPHRQRTIARFGGLEFVDDSLSTIPQSTAHALRALGERPVAVIVGGRDRGVDLTPLIEELRRPQVHRVALVSQTGPAIGRALEAGPAGGEGPEWRLVPNLDEAVAFCTAGLPAGGVVLLSPAAASGEEHLDAFERGAAFARAVERLRCRP